MKLVFDIETNNSNLGLVDTIFYVVAMDLDTDQLYVFEDAIEAVALLKKAKLLVAHNGIMYDLPVLQKLAGFNIEEWPLTLDTIILSRLFYNNVRKTHSLDSWGRDLGNLKGNFKDFTKRSQEMLDYCIQDVRVTRDLFKLIKSEWDFKHFSRSINLEHNFARVMSQQALNGFCLDIAKSEQLIKDLDTQIEEIKNKVIGILPKPKDLTHYNLCVKKGAIVDTLPNGYFYIARNKEVFKEWKYLEPNLNSRKQLIDFFTSKYGWEPDVMTAGSIAKRDEVISQVVPWKDRKYLSDEQIESKYGHLLPQLTPSIGEDVLKDMPYPEAKELAQYFTAVKSRASIKSFTDGDGWLDLVVNGRLYGSIITNGAITGRSTHNKPNFANVDKKNKRMRECWIAREGWDLVSVDFDALEARTMAALLFQFDGGDFARIIEEGKKEEGTDMHSRNQMALSLNSRDNAKRMLYALIYGAGNVKLGTIFAEDQALPSADKKQLFHWGLEARTKLIENINGLKDLLKSLETDELYGIDGRPLWPRKKHSAFNTLNQGAGAAICKQALINFWAETKRRGWKHFVDFGLTANVHDEQVLECRKDISKDITEAMVKCMEMTTEQFNLGCPIKAQGQIGANWGEIH